MQSLGDFIGVYILVIAPIEVGLYLALGLRCGDFPHFPVCLADAGSNPLKAALKPVKAARTLCRCQRVYKPIPAVAVTGQEYTLLAMSGPGHFVKRHFSLAIFMLLVITTRTQITIRTPLLGAQCNLAMRLNDELLQRSKSP